MASEHIRLETVVLPSPLHRPKVATPSPTLLDCVLGLLETSSSEKDRPTIDADAPSPTVPESKSQPPLAEGSIDESIARKPPRPTRKRKIAEAQDGGATSGRFANGGPAQSGQSLQDRIRALSSSEQQKLARTGEMTERKLLERMYGKGVWEALLNNSKLTPPEVATIARKGSVPVPLIETIVGNRAWLSAPPVRRALLTNPRLRKNLIQTVLSATPRSELKLIPKQTAYPSAIREAAQRMLK